MGVLSALRHRLSAAAERVGLSLCLFGVALLLVMVGAGAAVAALWLWFATLLPPPQAALATAAAAFALAGVTALIGRAVLRSRTPPRYPPRTAAPLSGAAAASMIGSELGASSGEWVRANLPGILVGALATGFVLGFSPRLRDALLRRLM